MSTTPFIVLCFSKEYQYFFKHQELEVTYPLQRKASIKDIIEALGVPHTEIGSLYRGTQELNFSYIPEPFDKINIFYHTLPLDFSQKTKLRPKLEKELSFICDVNVGKLAVLLRMLGFDTLFAARLRDEQIAHLASLEQRVVLTKDIGLLKRKQIHFGYLLRSSNPDEQLQEIKRVFGLKPRSFFQRCLLCNTPLKPVAKKDVLPLLEPRTKKYFQEFHFCPQCKKVYWPGSHFEKMKKRLQLNGFKI
ncbi:MAG: uncharacterized protein PWR24_1052 [Desulfonauticus sp.]|nr:uncharacterized protein [Desulfonauticus sp.]